MNRIERFGFEKCRAIVFFHRLQQNRPASFVDDPKTASYEQVIGFAAPPNRRNSSPPRKVLAIEITYLGGYLLRPSSRSYRVEPRRGGTPECSMWRIARRSCAFVIE
jgi:hypothetical protein